MNNSFTPEAEQRLRTISDNRIQINSLLSALCVAILTILLSIPAANLNNWVAGQLAAAVPTLVTSSLAYAKLTYRDMSEYHIWNTLAWITHSIGYIMILNSMVLLLYGNNYPMIAWVLLVLIIILFVTYSVLDVAAKRKRLREKTTKLVIYLFLLFTGSVIPILFGCV